MAQRGETSFLPPPSHTQDKDRETERRSIDRSPYFQLDLKHIDQVRGSNIVNIGIDLSEFYLSVEWDILEVPATRNEEYYLPQRLLEDLDGDGILDPPVQKTSSSSKGGKEAEDAHEDEDADGDHEGKLLTGG